MRACLGTVIALLTFACAQTRSAHMYPANDIATQQGVLTATFIAHGTGHGEITVDAPNGEHFQGEFSIVRGGAIGFGSIYGSVYGQGGATTASGTATTYSIPGGSPGTASAFGDRKTSLECEFFNDNFSGHGNGACRSSTGALYRLQY